MIVRYNPMESLTSDPGRHWGFGTRPLDTQPFAAIDPIGYHVYLGVIAKFTVHSPILVAYWTALLSLITPWLWYRFLRELFPDRTWALTGWVILAALPSWSIIYSFFMQETLMLPLLGAALWATWRCRRKRTTASFVVATGVWLLAGLTRGICIPLAAVAMTWVWFEQGRKLEKAVIGLALLVGVLGPLAGPQLVHCPRHLAAWHRDPLPTLSTGRHLALAVRIFPAWRHPAVGVRVHVAVRHASALRSPLRLA